LDLRRHAEALAGYENYIAIEPDSAEALSAKGRALLLLGELESGWGYYEWRHRCAASYPTRAPLLSQPRWHGEESLQGKTLLVHWEQGLGDTLQFCRYARLAEDLGARVLLEVQPALHRLCQSLTPTIEVVADLSRSSEAHYHCPLLSLPLAFKTTLTTIPCFGRYLSSEPNAGQQWRSRLGTSSALRVGLAWSGSAAHPNDLNRSISLADLIGHLPAGPRYVSLQKEIRERDREVLRSNPQILDVGAELRDLADTAALCDCMDVVVSVDTSVAHLAGALGRQTLILLPFSPDWRWRLDRTDSPWYPTVKLYRQACAGDWDSALTCVAAALRDMRPESL
jgi:hypothetical protein